MKMNALVSKHCAGQPLRWVIESLVCATELVSRARGRGEGAIYKTCYELLALSNAPGGAVRRKSLLLRGVGDS